MQEMWPEGEKNARTNFMLEKIVEEKGFTISDEELDIQIRGDRCIHGLGCRTGQSKIWPGLWMMLVYRMKMDKAVQYLVDNAVITEDEPSEEGIESE